jgi:hypothetical protein
LHKTGSAGGIEMGGNVFIQIDFLALIIFSFLLPVGIYAYMMWKKAISRIIVLLLGIILIVISGVDVFLLQHLTRTAETSAASSKMFFSHEFSVALYLLPLLFAGIGVNMISHILMTHLTDAEKKFDSEH